MPQLQIFLSDSTQQTFDILEEKTTVGRVDDNSLRLDDPSVSSHHAEILLVGEQLQIHDLGSTNGTFINGEQISDAVLNPGDELRFGSIVCYLREPEAFSSEAQPLPDSFAPSTLAGSESARPEGFVCSSPIPRNQKKKDPVALAALVMGGLALAAALAAAALGIAMTV